MRGMALDARTSSRTRATVQVFLQHAPALILVSERLPMAPALPSPRSSSTASRSAASARPGARTSTSRPGIITADASGR